MNNSAYIGTGTELPEFWYLVPARSPGPAYLWDVPPRRVFLHPGRLSSHKLRHQCVNEAGVVMRPLTWMKKCRQERKTAQRWRGRSRKRLVLLPSRWRLKTMSVSLCSATASGPLPVETQPHVCGGTGMMRTSEATETRTIGVGEDQLQEDGVVKETVEAGVLAVLL